MADTKNRGLSQEALSFKCDLHRTYVSLLERGFHAPTLDTRWFSGRRSGSQPPEIVRLVERELDKRPESNSPTTLSCCAL